MNIDQYYQSGRYEGLNDTEREKFFTHRLKIYEEILQKQRPKIVLDAGCGDGRMGEKMMVAWNAKVYGADISKTGIQLAKQKGVIARVADLSVKMPFENNFFDLVVADEILEHVHNPDTFIQECQRVLKKNGLLLLCTPNLTFWLNRFLFLFGIYPLFLEASTQRKVGMSIFSHFVFSKQPVGHVHVFNKHAIIEFLSMHEFSLENILGKPLFFESKPHEIITQMYWAIDNVLSNFSSLSSDLIILAKKR